jgi:hypothetical protein
MTPLRLVLLASLITAMTAACAGTNTSPPPIMPATTLMSGWEQHFTIDWTADERQNGTRRVTGHIYNYKGGYAEDVRLLALALDPSGVVIGQGIALVLGGVGSSGAYFEVPNLPAASSYQVSVWNYTMANSKSKR